MKTPYVTYATHELRVRKLFPALALLTILAINAAGSARHVLAQDIGAPPTGPPTVSPMSPTAPPELAKPALPRELETAESVFRKLDVDKRGYVTHDDTKDLIGFENAFMSVDTADSGKLNAAQFKKAWAIYKANK